MKRVDVLASDIMDLYYQTYKEENEDFFDLDFFIRQVVDAHAFLVRQEYKEQYAMLRGEGAHKVWGVTFSEQWLKKHTGKLEKDGKFFSVKLPDPVLSFPYDQSFCGIQLVVPHHCDVHRTSRAQYWALKFVDGVIFWWPEVTADSTKVTCSDNAPQELDVYYIPVPGEDTELDDGLADPIKDIVWTRMAKARQGEVVDTTNDSNTNTVPQSEINKEQVQ
jgi:hypothetical protein